MNGTSSYDKILFIIISIKLACPVKRGTNNGKFVIDTACQRYSRSVPYMWRHTIKGNMNVAKFGHKSDTYTHSEYEILTSHVNINDTNEIK